MAILINSGKHFMGAFLHHCLLLDIKVLELTPFKSSRMLCFLYKEEK